MVNEKRRGRPPTYDVETVLQSAQDVFWEFGFDAATVDRLSEAMGMSRPSLYGAFGDKEALFQRVLERFQDRMAASGHRALQAPDLEKALTSFFFQAIEVYVGERGARGCLMFSVANVVAPTESRLSQQVLSATTSVERQLAERFKKSATGDADMRAKMAGSVLHSLSVRARAGQSARGLKRFARASARFLASG